MHLRGYVDILRAATEGSGTMNSGDFGALPWIADDRGVCASCLQSLSGLIIWT